MLFKTKYSLRVGILFGVLFWTVDSKKSEKVALSYSSGVQVCADADSAGLLDSKVKALRYNESIGILDGPFELKKQIDGMWNIQMVVTKQLIAGGLEVVATHTLEDFCDKMKNKNNGNNIYGPYIRAINFPTTCPIPAGKYAVEKMIANSQSLKLNSMLLGKYKVEFTIISVKYVKQGLVESVVEKNEGCLQFECSVETLE